VKDLKTLIYAHRGASKTCPENTMCAFKKAQEVGAEGIELDVQLSKDNIPVIIHDEQLKRTTNGAGFVKDFTLKELKKLDAGSWFSSQFKDERIPTLEEVLKWIKNTNIELNIELKNNIIDYEGMEKIVYGLAKKYDMEKRVIYSSFNHESLQKLLKIDRSLQIAPLQSARMVEPWEYAKKLGATSMHIRFTSLSANTIKSFHKQGLKVRTYTVNRTFWMRRFFFWKVDALMTDYPEKALNVRDNKRRCWLW
jgi:glycerophosphoryl diester phosphodiesterase